MNFKENPIDQWIADGENVIEAVESGEGYGLVTPAEIRGLSGLQIINAMMGGEIPVTKLAEHLTFCTVVADEVTGIVTFQGQLLAEYLNPMGSIAGGWLSTVLDSAMGTAVLLQLPPGKSFTTTSLSVEFKARLPLYVGYVRIDGKMTGPMGRSVTAEGRVYDINGVEYAKATCVCRVFNVPTE